MSLSFLLIVVGRVLLGGLFVIGGIHHFRIVEPLTKSMTDRGVPSARLVLIAGSIFQIVCGVALMLGLYVAAAAFGLIVFTILASLMFLNYWDMEEGAPREAAFNNLMINVALIGGLMIAAA